jgi:predicted transglutaminase-like cysteine proteinase
MSGHRARQFCLTIQSTWTSPLGALAVGVGDCKQYAVLNYAVVQEAGFAPDDLRLVAVRIKSLRNNHAVVAVRQSAHWFILEPHLAGSPEQQASRLLCPAVRAR